MHHTPWTAIPAERDRWGDGAESDWVLALLLTNVVSSSEFEEDFRGARFRARR
ncbi:hypothetical protein GCM10027610_081120 [Dactylosporangium cerinum]